MCPYDIFILLPHSFYVTVLTILSINQIIMSVFQCGNV